MSQPIKSRGSYKSGNMQNSAADCSPDSNNSGYNLRNRSNVSNKTDASQDCSQDFEEEYSENEVDSSDVEEESFRQKSQINEKKSSSMLCYSFITVCVLVCIGTNFYISGESRATVDIRPLQVALTNQVWDNIESVINDSITVTPSYPAVFLFIYNSQKNKVNNLMEIFAKYASAMLLSEEYVTMDQNDIISQSTMRDYGNIIQKYKPLVEKNKVLLVHDIQLIPAKVSQAFHSFCDEYSPLVEEAVYIFTMEVESLDGDSNTIASQHLYETWKALDIDILSALVTRMTSTVIKIQNL